MDGKRSLGCAHRFRPTYPDFLHGAPPTPACAAFIKESRMNFGNARRSTGNPESALANVGTRRFPPATIRQKKVGQMPGPQSSIAQRRDDLERFEFMMGAERGRLAVTLDMLTDALILIGQHGVYCASHGTRLNPRSTWRQCWGNWVERKSSFNP